MPVISIAIQKGGSGKTTTAINLAAGLMRRGKSVLLIDADPQSNLSPALGITDELPDNLYTEMKAEISGDSGRLENTIIETNCGLHLVPSSIDLAGAELELVSAYGREHILRSLLEPLTGKYDIILIDCPPAIGMLTVNALAASDYVLLPLQAEYLPLKGLHSFIHHYDVIKSKLNRKLEILGIVCTRFDERKKLNKEIRRLMKEQFNDKVFNSCIRTNIQLAKAQEKGVDIFTFDKSSNGAIDYMAMVDECLEKL